MADAVADAEVAALFVIEQDGEEVVRQDALDDFGHIGQQLFEIESLGRSGRHFQQEVEQFRPFAKPNRGFTGGLHRTLGELAAAQAAVASIILTLALAPIRVAPAATMARRSSSVRMPPEAFTPISGPTTRRINATSCAVAPAVLKPVDV